MNYTASKNGDLIPYKEPSLRIGECVLSGTIVLEWSQQTQGFHIEPLVDALQTNINGFIRGGKTGDWVILGLFPDRESCDQFYNRLDKLMKIWGLSNLTPEDLMSQLSP